MLAFCHEAPGRYGLTKNGAQTIDEEKNDIQGTGDSAQEK